MFGKIYFQNKEAPNEHTTNNLFKKQSYIKRNYTQQQTSSNHQPLKSKFIKKEKGKGLFKNQLEDLQGAKFRILNEMLYSNQSKNALSYFKDNQQDFQIYHEGFRHQTTKWKYKPIDEIIQYILQNKPIYVTKKIVDLGCGDGFLQQSLMKNGFNSKRMRSYDLVKTKPFIVVADIANLHLNPKSVDLCIFCLSLMGTNYLKFILEAKRILKTEGELIISQVESRSSDWRKFIEMLQLCGFSLVNDGQHIVSSFREKKEQGRFFRTMHFRKNKEQVLSKKKIRFDNKNFELEEFSKIILEKCIYKKR